MGKYYEKANFNEFFLFDFFLHAINSQRVIFVAILTISCANGHVFTLMWFVETDEHFRLI